MMNKYLKISLIHFGIAGLITFLWLFCGCYTSFDSFCRHDAIYAALVVGEKYPVRIAYGPVDGKTIHHAQAQVFIKGKWEWLILSGRPFPMIGKKDKGWKVESYLSVEESLKWFKGNK